MPYLRRAQARRFALRQTLGRRQRYFNQQILSRDYGLTAAIYTALLQGIVFILTAAFVLLVRQRKQDKYTSTAASIFELVIERFSRRRRPRRHPLRRYLRRQFHRRQSFRLYYHPRLRCSCSSNYVDNARRQRALNTDRLPIPATQDDSTIATSDRNPPVFAMNTMPTVMMPLPFPRSPEAPHFTSDNVTSFLHNYKRMSLQYGYPDDRAAILIEDYCDEGVAVQVRSLQEEHPTLQALAEAMKERFSQFDKEQYLGTIEALTQYVDTIQYSRAFDRLCERHKTQERPSTGRKLSANTSAVCPVMCSVEL
ncbi:hypothetical protein M433DRAFT_159894 [Acidomyces richmondensis BFW]|nr:hypothetical protein M433DRAFT_159894 [Acidomyces richmondensis BFW]